MSIITTKIGKLEYLTAQGIPVPHCFTTRLGGVSQGNLASLNIGMNRGDDPSCVAENYRILGRAVGFEPEDLVLTRQTHSDIVRRVGKIDRLGLDHRDYPECDGLITNEPGVGLAVFTADCTPLLFHDPATGAVGAAHAGWRGTAAQIGGKTVEAMVSAFGCKPENIRAAIGPNIGQCCFETHEDVPQAMLESLGSGVEEFIQKGSDKYYVNLKGINRLILERAGVRHIEVSTDCTACQTDRFWSYRRMGAARGAQGAIIICKEGTM